MSLNELCRQVLEGYVTGTATEHSSQEKNRQGWFRALGELLPDSLLGVILFGSTARGEDRGSSDIDLLIVVSPDVPLRRRLYEMWDEQLPEERYSPHFVHLPESVALAGSIWYEAAVDGIVLHEVGRRVSRFLSRIRREIASGGLERKTAYGHPYWRRRAEGSSHVQ